MKKIRKAFDPLLSRDEFRANVFARDQNKCLVCGETAQDAHHIIDRRLFPDGGYYISNGASLCNRHHIEAEQTNITVELLREKAGIVAPAIPPHYYPDERYDKWGNIYINDHQRTKGELFYDESVQKILKQGGALLGFTDYVKYPRTLHLPWSPGASSDDRIHSDLKAFIGKEIIVTEKMDGENTSLYQNYYHARSIDSRSHPSQSWARGFHAKIAWGIPTGWRICAENLYSQHSIFYESLSAYIQAFSIWNDRNICLSWDQTLEWCALLGIPHVPVLYRGIWDQEKLEKMIPYESLESEGYVVRIAESFGFSEFHKVVGKYVRAGHSKTAHNWKSLPIRVNRLAE